MTFMYDFVDNDNGNAHSCAICDNNQQNDALAGQLTRLHIVHTTLSIDIPSSCSTFA